MTPRAGSWRGALGVGAALLATVLLLGWATDGFAVLTTDGARARRVASAPRPVPDVPVRDQTGAVRALLADATFADAAFADAAFAERAVAPVRPRAVIVDFIYTRCLTVCTVLGDTYQQLQRTIRERGLHDRVRLLTVSFDVAHDDAERLARYALVQRADPALWTLATPVDTTGRDALLRTFGVQVVPDGAGGWVHNAALHVVDPRGRLVRIAGITDVDGALAAALDAWASTP